MKTITTRANAYLIRCLYNIPHTILYTLPSILFNTSIALVVGKLAGEQPRILMLVAGAADSPLYTYSVLMLVAGALTR